MTESNYDCVCLGVLLIGWKCLHDELQKDIHNSGIILHTYCKISLCSIIYIFHVACRHLNYNLKQRSANFVNGQRAKNLKALQFLDQFQLYSVWKTCLCLGFNKIIFTKIDSPTVGHNLPTLNSYILLLDLQIHKFQSDMNHFTFQNISLPLLGKNWHLTLIRNHFSSKIYYLSVSKNYLINFFDFCSCYHCCGTDYHCRAQATLLLFS